MLQSYMMDLKILKTPKDVYVHLDMLHLHTLKTFFSAT